MNPRRKFRFTLEIDMPAPIGPKRHEVVIEDETLEAAQAELFNQPSTWLPRGAPLSTPWRILDVHEAFPPDYR